MKAVSRPHQARPRLHTEAAQTLLTLTTQEPLEINAVLARIEHVQIARACLVLLHLSHVDLIDHRVAELDTGPARRVLAAQARQHREALALHVQVQRLARVAHLALEVERVRPLLPRLEAHADLEA